MIDGTRIANRFNAVGSAGQVINRDDAAAINDATVMLEEWASLSDVNDNGIIAAYAEAELVYKRYGVTTYSIKPSTYGTVPRLHDDFELGDKVYFTAERGRMRIGRQAVRIFTATLSFDAAGNEVFDELGMSPG
jgi:hypothetical protein